MSRCADVLFQVNLVAKCGTVIAPPKGVKQQPPATAAARAPGLRRTTIGPAVSSPGVLKAKGATTSVRTARSQEEASYGGTT